MQKAFAALEANGIEYSFHDYKKLGISANKLAEWMDKEGIDAIINKQGLTWKKFSDEQKAAASSKDGAIALLMQNTSAIRRPILETEKKRIIGFDTTAEEYKTS